MKRNVLIQIVGGIKNDSVRRRLENWIMDREINVSKLRKMKLANVCLHLGPKTLRAFYNELWSDGRSMSWMDEFEAKQSARLSPDDVEGYEVSSSDVDWPSIESCMHKIAACAKATADFLVIRVKASRDATEYVFNAFPPDLDTGKWKHMLYIMNQRLKNCSVPFRFRYGANYDGDDVVSVVKKE